MGKVARRGDGENSYLDDFRRLGFVGFGAQYSVSLCGSLNAACVVTTRLDVKRKEERMGRVEPYRLAKKPSNKCNTSSGLLT